VLASARGGAEVQYSWGLLCSKLCSQFRSQGSGTCGHPVCAAAAGAAVNWLGKQVLYVATLASHIVPSLFIVQQPPPKHHLAAVSVLGAACVSVRSRHTDTLKHKSYTKSLYPEPFTTLPAHPAAGLRPPGAARDSVRRRWHALCMPCEQC
jgi:hypothetical protein